VVSNRLIASTLVGVLGVALSACSGGLTTEGRRSGNDRFERTALMSTDAISVLPKAPHDVGVSPSVVSAHGGVVVLGGVQMSDGLVKPTTSVQRYDSRTGWTELPDIPVGDALLGPGAVSDGETIFVVGTPCGPTSADEHESTCATGDVVAFASDATGSDWTKIPAPPHGPNERRLPAYVYGIGWSDGFAVFTIAIGGDTEVVAYDPVGSTWERTDIPNDGSSLPCLQGATVVAMNSATRSTVQDGLRVFAGGPADTITGSWLQTDERRLAWSSLPEFRPATKDAGSRPRATDVSCRGGRQVVATSFGDTTDGTGQAWLDMAGPTWTTVDPPETVAGGDFAAVVVDGTRLLWPVLSGNVFAQRVGSRAWSALNQPVPGDGLPLAFVPVGGPKVVAVLGAPNQTTDLVLVDVERLAASGTS
jgi:hypothetical protein